MTEGETWTKWAWRHYSLTMTEHDTYDEAVSSAHWAAENGEESLDCIEGPTGVVPEERVEADMNALREREWERYKEQPKATHVVKVAHPSDRAQSAFYSLHTSEEAAERSADRARAAFGDRVRVAPAGAL